MNYTFKKKLKMLEAPKPNNKIKTLAFFSLDRIFNIKYKCIKKQILNKRILIEKKIFSLL